MTVLVLERVAKSVRGDLSRWLVEVRTGVFVGRVTDLVREALWKRATLRAGRGSVLMVWRSNTEQGFELRVHNLVDRIPVDLDGLWLVEVVAPIARADLNPLPSAACKDMEPDSDPNPAP